MAAAAASSTACAARRRGRRVGSLTVEGGSFDHKRGTLDVGGPLGDHVAARLNGVYENSRGFRDASRLAAARRQPDGDDRRRRAPILRLDYEYFHDDRTVDRGIPSFRGVPSPAPITTFFGDPDVSHSRADVHARRGRDRPRASAAGSRCATARASMHYDKFYQNVFPGAVDTSGAQVSLQGYNNATERRNLFNQTDVTGTVATGAVRHTLLVGAELGRQRTDNFRNTGYFNGSATSTSTAVPFATPDQPRERRVPPERDRRRQPRAGGRRRAVRAGPDRALVAAGRRSRACASTRFDVRFHNNRNDQDLDAIRSARVAARGAGLQAGRRPPRSTPRTACRTSRARATSSPRSRRRRRRSSPSSSATTRSAPSGTCAETLALTAALFQLDRSNSTAPDPANPTRTVQTGAQRTHGLRAGRRPAR